MRQQNLYLIVLVLLSWTHLSGQSGTSRDTSRTYGLTELRHIAETAVNFRTCDTLLSTSKKIIANRDTMIKEKDYTISQYSLTIGIKDEFIKNREDSIAKQIKTIKKLNNKIKLIKIGWLSTAIAEAALILYFIIH